MLEEEPNSDDNKSDIVFDDNVVAQDNW